MAIADDIELKSRLAALMGSAWSTNLDEPAQDGAISQAFEELGWSYPILMPRKAYWLIERCKRHALYITLIAQAERFQYKQIRLQHKFENYFKLISAADVAFAKALEEESALMDVSIMDAELSALFAKGFFLNPAGFIYDQIGRDLTYVYS
jgi:hypothetical protein